MIFMLIFTVLKDAASKAVSGGASKWLTVILWYGNVYFPYSGEQAEKWKTVVDAPVSQQLNNVKIYTQHAFPDDLM